MKLFTFIVFHFWLIMMEAKETKPNIVLILADDMGWDDIGFHGSDEISTPFLDKLANEGVKLNRYYTQPLCTPSRSALLTGRYPIHTGMQSYVIDHGQAWGPSLNEVFLPQKLKELGYSTHAVGKWHLGYYKKEFTPTYRGFDTFDGFYLADTDYFNITNTLFNEYGLDLHHDVKGKLEVNWKKNGVYSTKLFTEQASDIIEYHNVSQPLFLYLAYASPHTGWRMYPPIYDRIQVPQNWVDKFRHIKHIGRRKYVANIAYLDYGVSQVYKSLEKQKMLDNTVIIFISDNGAEPNGFRSNWGSNVPLRGAKFTLFEGGVRVPGFIYGKNLGSTKKSVNSLFHVTDWFPTIITLAGGILSKDHSLDGFDQLPSIKGGKKSRRNEILLNIDGLFKAKGLIHGEWKLVKQGKIGRSSSGSGWCVPPKKSQLRSNKNRYFPECLMANAQCKNEFCLFNLKYDPAERDDMSRDRPDIMKKLMERLKTYEKSMVPTLFRNEFAKEANPIYHNKTFVPWM